MLGWRGMFLDYLIPKKAKRGKRIHNDERTWARHSHLGIGVFVGMDHTLAPEDKYFDDSTNATCYITKDKMFLNKQINDDAYNNDITLDISGGMRCNNVILGYSDTTTNGNIRFNCA